LINLNIWNTKYKILGLATLFHKNNSRAHAYTHIHAMLALMQCFDTVTNDIWRLTNNCEISNYFFWLVPWWKYIRCALAYFEHKKSDIQKSLCCRSYLKLALCHYVIMTLYVEFFSFGNRKKCKFLHPFFF